MGLVHLSFSTPVARQRCKLPWSNFPEMLKKFHGKVYMYFPILLYRTIFKQNFLKSGNFQKTCIPMSTYMGTSVFSTSCVLRCLAQRQHWDLGWSQLLVLFFFVLVNCLYLKELWLLLGLLPRRLTTGMSSWANPSLKMNLMSQR